MKGLFVSTQMLQDQELLLDLDPNDGGEVLVLPPGMVLSGEKLACRALN